MRLRNIKGSREIVDNHRKVLDNPQQYRGQWQRFFGNNHPIQMEIGIGMGDFVMGMATRHSDRNYIGIEKMSGVLARTVRKFDRLDQEFPNLVFLRQDATDLGAFFGEAEIDKIYLNFSDPWPKERYKKRRLTHPNFLNQYRTILKSDGLLQFKTDNEELFDYSLEMIEQSKFEVIALSRDLHRSVYAAENIMTEYERKFSEIGKNINYLVIRNQK